MKTREDREWSNLILFFSKLSFWDYIKKINTFSFQCMVIPLGPHSVYTYWGAQRLCKLVFFKYWTMEVGPSSQTMEEGHLPWSAFMGHGVNRLFVWCDWCYVKSILICKFKGWSCIINVSCCRKTSVQPPPPPWVPRLAVISIVHEVQKKAIPYT